MLIRFSAIGDIVWTSAMVRALQNQVAPVSIHFCTKASYRDLVIHNPHIDVCHFLQEDFSALLKQLKQENFDYIVDLHANLRSTRIKWALGVKSFTFHKRYWKRWLLVRFKVNLFDHRHIADWYWEALEKMGVHDDGKGLEFYIDPQDEVNREQLPETHRKSYVAIVIGASRYTKRVPVEKLLDICKKVNAPIMLIGGKEDRESGEQIRQYFQDNPFQALAIYNACGQFSLAQSASLVRQCSYLVGNDTGLMHIATAFQKKIYAFFGGTAALYTYPYRATHQILETHGLACRPCSRHGKDQCPLGHFKCMREISLDNFAPNPQI